MNDDARIGQLESDPAPLGTRVAALRSASRGAVASPSPPLTCNFPRAPRPHMLSSRFTANSFQQQATAWSQVV